MKKTRALPLLFVPLLLAQGCQLAPEYQRPAMDVSDGWRMPKPAGENPVPVIENWWTYFHSEELNRLIESALKNNNDLAASLARISQARAQAKIAGADLWPDADASGNLTRSRDKPGNGTARTDNSYRGVLSVAYELDLWGKNRNSASSAEARLDSRQFDYEALALVTAADTAGTYFQVSNLRDRLAIAQENLANTQEVLHIVEAQFKEGRASALEVSQQKTAYANAEASLVSLENQTINAENTLALLLGITPKELKVGKYNLQSAKVPVVALTQPSTLLEKRPDIRRAESDLISANADIGAARAAFFPSVTLGGNLSAAANPASSAASTTTAIVGGVSVPIFKGGALFGALDQTKARKEELVANYRSTVLNSFKEVEDALASVKSAQQRLAALRTASTEARNAYRISRERYKAGAVDFLTLLDTQRAQLNADDDYIRAELDILTATISLFKALGGR
ncbi:MAG: efflux transporter outer membrane subunit [Proteobacteria bacterium]|nr:efflux transporter outer membrane subunit [Pseudomonadota bacterium]